MASYNRVCLIGHLGRDATKKEFDNGGGLIRFSMATTDVWKDRAGKKQERTDWHNVEMNEEHAKNLLQYLVKGKLVLVEGELRYDRWEKDGVKQTASKIRAIKIVLLSSSGQTGRRAETDEPAPTQEPGPFQVSDDDVPF